MQTVIQYSRDPLNDYRLILDTPSSVKKKVAATKISFDEDYRGTVIAGGNPFIYLATFSQHESNEQALVDALDRIALGFMPFKLHMKDFGYVDENEIFIGIDTKEPIEMLVKQVKSLENLMLTARFNDLPRVSIALRLQPWQFQKSWPKYSHKHMAASFLADNMLLLKRMEGFRSWQVLKYMAFQNQLVVPVTGADRPGSQTLYS